MTSRRPLRAVLLAAVLGLAVVACGDDGGGGGPSDAAGSSTTVAPPGTTPTTTTVPGQTAPVEVFFARDGKVATAGRQVAPPAVARGAMEALLAGPDEGEQALGMTTALGSGVSLLDIQVSDGLATVALSGLVGTGDTDVALEVAQVVFTLTQFPTVDEVTILPEGVAADSLGFDAVPIVELDRSDVEDQTPFILVESPTPGETVDSPVTVSGIANTFEANVQFEVVDPDRQRLGHGFTTASAGSGTWGDFSFTTVDLPEGDATIEVFQESAEDGSRTDVYEVPVTVG